MRLYWWRVLTNEVAGAGNGVLAKASAVAWTTCEDVT